MKSLYLLILLCFSPFLIHSQSFNDSNLPIIVIQTDLVNGQPIEIPDEPKVLASMKVIWHQDGNRNLVTDQNNSLFLNYDGKIKIEIRGSSSQALPKKSYGLTTIKDNGDNNNVTILGLAEENDWVLNSLAFDPSLIRDNLSYALATKSGNYASRGNYCELIVNGDYKGIYLFMEKLKIDSDRIDIEKLEQDDNSGIELTGGYITKADKTTGGDPIAWTMLSYNGYTDYIHDFPKPEDITLEQASYIKSIFYSLQSAASAQNTSVTSGFPSIIDIPTFIDFILINELASNADAYQFSTFFHKDRGGKLRAGPVWDFNLTFGNDLFLWGFDRSHTNIWQYNDGNTGSRFWKDLALNDLFFCQMGQRWNELTSEYGVWDYVTIEQHIDSLVSLISEAKDREQARWATIGNHQEEISNLKDWLNERVQWLNTHFTQTQCALPSIPDLVISEINYAPISMNHFDKDDLEFIGITNRSNFSESIDGVYFSKLGISFQFPLGSVIQGNETIYVCSDSNAFFASFGKRPMGQFVRNLSNKEQTLELRTAWGELIDRVHYKDSYPWPEEADGNGYYLKLNNLSSDNSLAENWIFKSILDTSLQQTDSFVQTQLYPNPVQHLFHIKSSRTLYQVEVFDVLGRLIMHKKSILSNSYSISLQSVPNGVYFVRMQFVASSIPITQKVIKILN